MQKTHRDEQEKTLLKLYREYRDTWDRRKNHGTWVEVTPYQKGWVRFYVLREDARNRNDANRLRKVLDLVNYKKYCPREDFTIPLRKNGRVVKGKRVPIDQKLNWLTEKQYSELPDDIRKYFVRQTWTERRMYPTKHYVTIVGYVPTMPEYFVFQVEQNIITHHFVPDGEWESHVAEIQNKIDRENLWPKINKALSRSMHNGYHFHDERSVYAKNRYGEFLTKEDLEQDDD